jgi:glyoxylase-like metal-dependent hydrolase (beta-lactamase superfamily II)
MQIAFTGFTTTEQSQASSRTRSKLGALAAVMAVAALTVLVPTRILAQANGEFLPLPAQAKPQDEPPEGFRLQRAGKNGYVVTLNVGGERFELIYPGPNHETGNIIVYVPQEKLAVMTDLVMPGWVPYRGWGNADHIPGILKAHDALLELDFDTYVGGHVYRTGTRRDVEQSRAYLVDLLNWTKEEMSAVPFKPAAEPANVWAAQKVWLDQVATRVTARLVAKWKDTLAGADTFTHDTVSAAIVSLSTDAPKIPPESLK